MATSELPTSLVRAAREKRGERQADVAAAAGISVSYLSMIEHGLRPPEGKQVAIAAALEQPATELWPA